MFGKFVVSWLHQSGEYVRRDSFPCVQHHISSEDGERNIGATGAPG